MRTRWLVACVTGLALVATACGGRSHETSSSSQFGARAVAWRAARYAAGRADVENLTRFFDQHVVVEDRVYDGRVIPDRRSYLKALGQFTMVIGTGTSDPAEPMALLVSADQVLDQFYDPPHMPWAPAADDLVFLGTMGPRGYTHVIMTASMQHWRAQIPTPPGLDRVEDLADRYVALWNGDEGVRPADVYSQAASVQDTLTGYSLHGLKQLRAALGSRNGPDLPRMEISVLPASLANDPTPSRPPRGLAIYFGPAVPGTTESDQMILLLDVDDGSGCPGAVGAALAVDQGRITSERRYHAVESVRRCYDPGTLKPGWWQGIDTPTPVPHKLTGTITWAEPSRSVEIYNGTPSTNEYVRWGLQRFADAGLTVPQVDSVTFVRQQSRCPLGRRGYSRYDHSSGDIFLCFHPAQVQESDAGQTLLHELSHVWLYQTVTHDTQQAFMRLVGVSRWEDLNDDWDQRGVEQAANTMMFGLMNEPLTMQPAVCQAFAAEFKLLTDADPLAPCSP